MSQLLSPFVPGLLALAAHALLLIAALRLRWPESPMAAHLGCGVIGMAAAVAIVLLGGVAAAVWPSLAFFVFGWTLLLFAYSAVYKSVSLRLLLLAAQEASPASCAELSGRILRKGFNERINLLVARGLVEERDSVCGLTPAGKRAVAAIGKWRDIFAAKTSGMYGLRDSEPSGS